MLFPNLPGNQVKCPDIKFLVERQNQLFSNIPGIQVKSPDIKFQVESLQNQCYSTIRTN